MEINIQYSNLDSTPSLTAYIQSKLGTLEKRLVAFDPTASAQLHLELSRTTRHHHKGLVYKVSAKLVLPKRTIHADHEDANVRTAVHHVKDILSESLSKYKETKV